jgi:hypothetical protein
MVDTRETIAAYRKQPNVEKFELAQSELTAEIGSGPAGQSSEADWHQCMALTSIAISLQMLVRLVAQFVCEYLKRR